jgi:hypothetical protein
VSCGDALDGPFTPKPPKMRWAIYKRLRAVEATLKAQWLRGAAGSAGTKPLGCTTARELGCVTFSVLRQASNTTKCV